jgi:arginase
VEGGIVWRKELLDQLTAARAAILRHKPEAIVTLGGDCLIDLAPIVYLSESCWNWLATRRREFREIST